MSFNEEMKGVATSIATSVWWIVDSVVAKTFFSLNHHVGIEGDRAAAGGGRGLPLDDIFI